MPLPAAPPCLPPTITRTLTAAADPPPQRVAIIAATYEQFARWCHEHQVSVREKRLIHLTESNCWWILRGAREIRYILLDWPLQLSPHGRARILAELQLRQATEVTAEELAAWEQSIAAGRTR